MIMLTEDSSSLLKAAKILQISGLITLGVKDEPLSFSDTQSAHPDNGDLTISIENNQSSGMSLGTSGNEDVDKLQSFNETRINTVSSSSDFENLPQAKWQEHMHKESVYSVPAMEAADPLDINNQEILEDAALSSKASHRCSLMTDVLVLLPDQDDLSRDTEYEYSTKREVSYTLRRPPG